METLTKVEELRLIASCVASGDHRAYARLVEAWQPQLVGYLRGLTGGDTWLADDLAQEAFVKAYQSLSTFRGAARFGTWLFTIATRLYLDSRRKILPAGNIDEARGAVSDSRIERDLEVRHDLGVALKSLSPLDRSIVLLFYLRDMPVRKVARIVDMKPETVKVRLHRAKEKMRLTLKKYDYEK